MLLSGALMVTLGVGIAYLALAPGLPSLADLRDIRLQVPLKVYTREGQLVAEFGEKRRTPVTVEDVPQTLIQAFLAAEDDRYYEHPGVDYRGLIRAAWHLVRTGEKGPGGSTITMQMARNYFLSFEQTFLRKFNEIFLALKIERELNKDEILELYLNKIYLGNRAYGVVAAAHVYYATELDQLTLAQTAMIAGLPKAPSRFNPIVDPQRAITRRDYVLARMLELGYVNEDQYLEAVVAPVTAGLHGAAAEVSASYAAEMVRADMVERFGNEAYTGGYRVFTTLSGRLQLAANTALHNALLDYDRRHGYRGAESKVTLSGEVDTDAWDGVLTDFREVSGLAPALVVEVTAEQAILYIGDEMVVTLDMDAVAWANAYVNENRRGANPSTVDEVLQPGHVVRIRRTEEGGWQLAQIPDVQGALVALQPRDGAIRALVGGFDFSLSKFNRVTQSARQPGSSFKPFIYSAALQAGYTPATIVNDAPVVFDDPQLEATWRPENFSQKFYGPTRLREALVNSRNLVSIRVLRGIGVDYARDYLGRFGFPKDRLPRDLSLALGSAAMPPLTMATAFATFANGGFRIEPYLVETVFNSAGEEVYRARPLTACPECDGEEDFVRLDPIPDIGGMFAGDGFGPPTPPPFRVAKRALNEQNAYIVNTMLRDVIRRGTGRKALALGRSDLHGKTGTTNEQRDAWFSGFNHHLAVSAWVGFDRFDPLGDLEVGGRAALPMWIEFMETALSGVPEHSPAMPPGIVTVRIDPETGLAAAADNPDAILEVFMSDALPDHGQGITGTAHPHAEEEENPYDLF
ncbi:MAG: penicillin-binding protein 1A [Gammaproteobacteria bacterium]|nr:MAG: penicillin-binding protein 1A [Gammaproteobacteria bacterium]